MKILYIDCHSGISGDMFVSALIDAGLNKNVLIKELEKLKLKNQCKIYIQNVIVNGISAKRFIVKEDKEIARDISDIEKIVKRSEFDKEIKIKILNMFYKLYEVERKIHKRFSHFHELGRLDTIVDITSAIVGLKILNIDKVFASKVNVGSGVIKTHHGDLPVPAPATAELLKNVPIFAEGPETELTTPTGALILKEFVEEFQMPDFKLRSIGYGAGSKSFPNFLNVLRVFIGETENINTSRKVMIETNIDDLNPQIYGYLFEKLFENNALDVTLTPIYMKKNRPGILLSCICDEKYKERILKIIFEETTSIGVRIFYPERIELSREKKIIKTKYGNVDVKISKYNDRIVNIAPEYESCKKLAQKNKIPLKEIYNQIISEIKKL